MAFTWSSSFSSKIDASSISLSLATSASMAYFLAPFPLECSNVFVDGIQLQRLYKHTQRLNSCERQLQCTTSSFPAGQICSTVGEASTVSRCVPMFCVSKQTVNTDATERGSACAHHQTSNLATDLSSGPKVRGIKGVAQVLRVHTEPGSGNGQVEAPAQCKTMTTLQVSLF